MRRVIVAIVGLLLAATVAEALLNAWFWIRLPNRGVTVEGLRAEIEQALPYGCAKKDVQAFLAAKGISHSASTQEVRASVRGTSKTLFIEGGIFMKFAFDEQDRLVSYSIEKGFTGP